MTKQASLNGVIALIIALAVGMPSLRAQELTLSAEDMQYDAQAASITLDGDASDWADAEFKSQVPFEKGGELVLFEEYGGGTWSGVEDHSSAVAFAWDASNLYIGVVVTDDTHQNGGSGWNGDSIQMVFANAAQDTVTHLYNYGLSDGGDVVIMNEKGPGGSEASITRDEDTATTLYEFSFPAASLGLDGYESGMQIGVGVCVNDGDTQDGQGGQKGWSGWGPYAAVYGKTASATGLVSLVGEAPGDDLTLSAEDMQYDAQGASITLDGDASDWAAAEFKSQVPFEKGGELVLFEEYGGGTWSGPADHSSAVAFAWDASNLYIGVVVTDDTHQNGGSGWNGDSIQMVFANAAQDTVTHLYNYGLSDGGDVVIMNEKGPGGSEASITRDEDTATTLYEFSFPAASLGLDGYESGMQIGVGVCVNDGDTQDGQGGQKGWSGWGPYAAVYGKTASATGLVSLVGEAPGDDLTLSAEDMQYDAQGASITLDGDASDWAAAEFKSQVPFEKGGELVLFEEYGGGTWSGPADHSSAVAFAWDASNLYIGVVVTDDTHQNGGSGWNGDSIQMVFANAAQDTVTHLYNYGLSDGGDVVIMNEKGPGGSEASITRDEDTATTLYEFSFPAASLGLDGYESGMQIGVGVCVNDGDTQDGQGGQKGWSGWGPYAAVYGKTASATGLVSLVGEAPGDDLTLSAEDMQYDAQGASITLDGDASDWAAAEFKSQVPFEKGGELVLFEEYGGGTWSGPADHSSAVAFAWDASNLYIGVVVTDDTHQNGGSGWNGDSIQMVFANAAQDTVTHLYNYGLSDGGDVVIMNEKGPGGSEASITRDEDTATTLYEFSFPAASLGLDGYESGMQIGVGVCVNDGDTQDGQGGQKGWSGWGPYAAVYGKTASATGLVSLVGEAPGDDLTLSAEDMQYDAQGASITLDGDASDWAAAEFKSQVPFEKGGELVLFEEYGGGTWSGPADHSSAVAFAWDASNLYIGVVVTDDTHQNGGSGWNGDSIQMVFANAAQDTVTHLYNYGLSDGGDVVIMNEKGPGGSEASITRDEDTATTLYEFSFPAASLGLDGYESGMQIGVGVCVNDGDTQDGQGGQKGWSGWGPYAAVYGKTASATGLVSLVGEAPGDDLTLSAEDMQYDAQGASITLDGDASDWAAAEFKSQVPFEKGGELVLFEEYGGGTWSGPADHSSAVAFAWDASNLYIGVVVTDDTHQNGGSGWNGDSIQMVFANAAQDTVTHLYNYGLSDGGDVVIMNEKGPGGSEASITRDEDTATTLYEFSFPAASLGLDGYESGMQIGVGVCVNDGDTQDGQGGQKGWSGWGPYAAVYGKTASATGLVSLVGEAPGDDLTLSAEDMQYDAQGASITLDGDASDWAAAEFKSQVPFEKGGELVLFEEYGGGTWSGPADHSSAVAFAWDASNLYIGVVVTDDTHQNGGSGWNGDSIQMVFANAAQDTVTHLYNYGLSDGGDVVIMNEKGPGGSEASITRDEDTATTLYEFSFPAASLGLDGYESGMSIGVGICVNDGDTQDGQGGQKGWSGWGPYAAVYGKTASATGLVNLVGEPGGADTPALSIVNNGDGTVTVTFEGTLQSADSVNGPWSDVDAASPLTLPAGEAAQFGRAKN